MAEGFEPGYTLPGNVRRTGASLLDTACVRIHDPAISEEEKVHQGRLACKRMRALLRLVRKQLGAAYERENRAYRDLARALGRQRDRDIALALFDKLAKEQAGNFQPKDRGRLRALLDCPADGATSSSGVAELLDTALREIARSRERLMRLDLEDAPPDACVQNLIRLYRSARKDAWRLVPESPASDFHEWRKTVKYLRYQLEFLQRLEPNRLKAEARLAKDLETVLGDEHDLVILCEQLVQAADSSGDGELVSRYASLLRDRQAALRREAVCLGRQFFSEEPKMYRDRLVGYWNVARANEG